MAGTKSQQSSKAQSFPKSKEKTMLNLEDLNKLIQNAAPKYNDKLSFEINYFLIALTSITFQYLHIYRLVIY